MCRRREFTLYRCSIYIGIGVVFTLVSVFQHVSFCLFPESAGTTKTATDARRGEMRRASEQLAHFIILLFCV